MDFTAIGLFLISAIALLGSPGPAIAALIAVGRAEGVKQGLRYLGGMLVGLSVAAAASAAGLFSIIGVIPSAIYVMSFIAGAYLIYLAFKIATAPVGNPGLSGNIPSSAKAGFVLGLSNPKGYVAFLSLYASFLLIPGSPNADSLLKWVLTVWVMITVDTIWLFVGVALRSTTLEPTSERIMNVVLGLMILLATVLAFI